MFKTSMTYKEKCEIIQYLVNLAHRDQSVLRVSENEVGLYSMIYGSLHRISIEHREIIINDFIQKKDRDWYLEFYSRSTYYRLKNGAMSSFLNCLGIYKMI